MDKKTKQATDKVQQVMTELRAAFPERDQLVVGTLTALIAGEHALMLGPPGTAKSLYARTFADCVADGSIFEILLTKFSTIEDLYGPISFKALKEDRYERILDGHACSKRVWFIDEIFKSSVAILNAMLTAMQERVFHNGKDAVDIPLETVLAASNEYPQDDSLEALYDRFSIKFWVDYLADADTLAKLLERGGIETPTARMSADELEVLRDAVCAVEFRQSDVQTMLKIKAAVTDDGFIVSDRTWVKATKMVKAKAVLAGRDTIQITDFMVLADMLWKEHKDRTRLKTIVEP